MNYEDPMKASKPSTKEAGSGHYFSEVEIQLPKHDADVILVLPNGEKIQVQFRACDEHPSIDICLPYDTSVTNWKGDDMEDAPPINGHDDPNCQHIRVVKQLVIALKEESVQ
jgi:hypothetical protein